MKRVILAIIVAAVISGTGCAGTLMEIDLRNADQIRAANTRYEYTGERGIEEVLETKGFSFLDLVKIIDIFDGRIQILRIEWGKDFD